MRPASPPTQMDIQTRAISRLVALAAFFFLLSLLAIPGFLSPTAAMILFFYGMSLLIFVGCFSIRLMELQQPMLGG
jgi:hypothetical protein